ncbi:uncharacterized protein LOC114446455 [Parambassis ranga]|uniref:Uncharacterized protein LOC114446455 n=1 Tax=Parambassis ranga TaxID=210632 RepID=A0A6P7JM72_9TELE|nr:uncharacterized protein LOC114446455 [Parambassis ranga]
MTSFYGSQAILSSSYSRSQPNRSKQRLDADDYFLQEDGVPGFICYCVAERGRSYSCPHLCFRTTASAATAAETVTHRYGGMEGSRNPETMPAVQAASSAVSLHSDHETDSFLTAARLLRGGWLGEGNKTKQQFVYSNTPVGRPSRSTSGQHLVLNCAETFLSGSRTGLVLVTNSKKTAKDHETGSEKKTSEHKPTPAGTLSTKRQADRRTGVLWTSGCRSTCQQIRRFKAPLLPAIAEI